MNERRSRTIYDAVTTIGDLRLDLAEYDDDDDDDIAGDTVVSALDVIEAYPSSQGASIAKMLALLFPNDNKATLTLSLRMFAPARSSVSIPL